MYVNIPFADPMGNIPLQGTDTYPTKKGTSEKSIDSEKVPGWDQGYDI